MGESHITICHRMNEMNVMHIYRVLHFIMTHIKLLIHNVYIRKKRKRVETVCLSTPTYIHTIRCYASYFKITRCAKNASHHKGNVNYLIFHDWLQIPWHDLHYLYANRLSRRHFAHFPMGHFLTFTLLWCPSNSSIKKHGKASYDEYHNLIRSFTKRNIKLIGGERERGREPAHVSPGN